MNNNDINNIVGDYKFGFKTDVENVYDTGHGISEEVVRKISQMKNEPEWMLNIRLKAYHEFAKMKWPTFGPDLSSINFDEYIYYIKSSEKTEKDWNNVPTAIKDTFDKLGIMEAEQKYFGGIKDGIKEEEIAGATNKIKLMCLKMFGDGETDDGTYTLTKLFKTLSSSKLGKLRKDGVDALVPIVQAISLLADTVIKMGDQKIFSDERINLGMSNFQKISGLFSEFTNLCVGLRERQSGSTAHSDCLLHGASYWRGLRLDLAGY